jgi:hypothetical protein
VTAAEQGIAGSVDNPKPVENPRPVKTPVTLDLK